MKKYLSLLLALLLALSLTACGGSKEDPAKTEEPANVEEPAAEPVEIIVFAAASMQESLNAAIEGYKAVAPEVTVVTTYDSSGTLLTQMRDNHNTVLVVEHNRDMIQLADQVIELGPLAGREGGEIVFQGTVEQLRQADTPTARSLRETIPANPAPRPWTESYPIEHAKLHNLKDVTVEIPKGVLTAVSGMAGSGKSSLIRHEFAQQYPEAIVIDQKPIGVSSRSTPATYTGAMDEIRKIFAKANKVGAEWFSFNSKGACPVCKGKGEIATDVAFADPVTVRRPPV